MKKREETTMEKQKMEERTMEENKKKNPDSERKSKLVSAILMAFVCVVMMGGGTYAWFTMNNVARVQSLKLNVASEGNLYISKTNDFTDKMSEVDWFGESTSIETLYPCTMDSDRNVYKPVYESDKVVSGKEAVDVANDTTDDADAKDTYYLEETFYLKLDDGLDADHSEYSVKLAKGTSTTSGGTTTYDGTYFILDETATPTPTPNPSYCVRVSFTPDGGNTVVYEPNSNVSNSGEYATSSIPNHTPIATTSGCAQKDNGQFVKDNDEIGDSEELFEITGGTAKKVVVRVWFEGTDDDCCNEIELKDIIAQLKFVATKKDA